MDACLPKLLGSILKMAGFNNKGVAICCGALLLVFSLAGNAQCLDCHGVEDDPAVARLSGAVHGKLPGDEENCIACHGTSDNHVDSLGDESPDVSFGPNWKSPAPDRAASCQSCHEGQNHRLWSGSAHEQENLACDDCHNAHQQADLATASHQAEQLCLGCHPRVRSELNLPSRHPIREGKTACTDCHDPHGSLGEASLKQLSVNDNCLSCHEDKRGPFLWEHTPATEDCSTCHRPHGSMHERLLTARSPALCQQCHAAAFHPSLPYGGEGLPGGAPSQYLLGKSCLNCHSQIHGSNHPSGARLIR